MEKPLPLRGGVMLNEEHLPHASIQEGGIQSFRSPHMSFNLLKKPVDCGHSAPVSVSRNCSSNSFWRSVRPVGVSTSICTTMSPKPRPFRTGIPDRTSVVKGKSVQIRVDIGGASNIKKK